LPNIAKIERQSTVKRQVTIWQFFQVWQSALMLILGIDTSGRSGGITLAEGDARSFRSIESTPIAGGTFSAQLVPTIAALLGKHGHTAKDLRGFAVASGPGSFTGLRVGLSAVKGLAEVLGQPIATVSILQAVAAGATWEGKPRPSHPVCRAVLDASREEVFLGEYECLHQPAPKILSESLLSLAALADRVSAWGDSANLVTPDATVVAVLQRLVPNSVRESISLVPRPTSEDIARIGLGKLLAGETVSVEKLDANYIRRSDAEIFSKVDR
jgi:tRNA threonylcarbamoyladenosine biosynthesis protein TsaB